MAAVIPDLRTIFTPPKPIRHSDHPTQFFYGTPRPQRSNSPIPIHTYEISRKQANHKLTSWSKNSNFQFTKTLVNENAIFDRHFHRYRKRLQDFSNIFFNYELVVQNKVPQDDLSIQLVEKKSKEDLLNKSIHKQKTQKSIKQKAEQPRELKKVAKQKGKADILFYRTDSSGKDRNQISNQIREQRQSIKLATPQLTRKQSTKQLRSSKSIQFAERRQTKKTTFGQIAPKLKKQRVEKKYKYRFRLQILNNLQKFKKNPNFYLGNSATVIKEIKGIKRIAYEVGASVSAEEVCRHLAARNIQAIQSDQ